MTHVAAVLTVFLLGGCALWASRAPVDTSDLSRAETLVASGDYGAALVLYDEVLRRRPDPRSTERARVGKSAVATLLEARDQVASSQREIARLERDAAERRGDVERLQREIARLERDAGERRAEAERLQQELATRTREVARLAADLGRTRQELVDRRNELTRLAEETERMRTALEDLKRLDQRLERGR